MKKIIIGTLCVFIFLFSILGVFALTPKEDKGVKVLKGDSLVYEQPTRATPFSLDKAPDTIQYWKSILPYKEDKNADMYIVLPTLGIISPIISLDKNSIDYKKMFEGEKVDINKYLIRGVLHYAGTGTPGEEGNPVIFGHSNFYKKGLGNYKTIFADIMNLDVSLYDEIWFFIKEENNKYDLRKFSIIASYETTPMDIGIMDPQGGKEVTVYTCTNGLEGRRVLKGKYIEKDETLIPYPIKREMVNLLQILKNIENKRRKKILEKVLSKVEFIKKNIIGHHLTYHDKFKKYLLNWIEKRLIEMY